MSSIESSKRILLYAQARGMLAPIKGFSINDGMYTRDNYALRIGKDYLQLWHKDWHRPVIQDKTSPETTAFCMWFMCSRYTLFDGYKNYIVEDEGECYALRTKTKYIGWFECNCEGIQLMIKCL